MSKNSPVEPSDWLEQAFPQIHYLLLAMDGHDNADRWLAENSHGVALFSRTLAGQKQARASLEVDNGDGLDDLFELIDNEDLTAWLKERRPDLYSLFRSIQGDEAAAGELKKRRPGYAKLVPLFRQVHQRFLQRSQSDNGLIENGAMADMGCLIGEMHLRQGEYEKAIEAFSRAIETRPSADLFEGRARAYRGLAQRDESAAHLLRQRHSEPQK